MQHDQILGSRYRLIGTLGVGGMAVVWKAHDELLNRRVAVKILAGAQTASPAARRRVQAEAQAAAQLSHPNVTNVYDYGEAPDDTGDCVPYVVMEFLPGRTLSQRLASGPLPPRAALRICGEVASALAAAHAQHVVHRDVKPANVMLTPSGAKVLDFGLAAVAGEPDLDEEGQLLGTAAYLAPERLTGDEVLPASDVYALGLLIHRALTDELPWEADTPSQMLNAHVYIEPDPLPTISGVPEAVNQMCNRCLTKDPTDRPSAAEVATVLLEAAGIVRQPSDDLPADRAPVPASADPVDPERPAVAAGPPHATAGTATGRRWRAAAAVAAVAAAAAITTAALLQLDTRSSDGDAAATAEQGASRAPGPAGPSAGPIIAGDDARSATATPNPTRNPTAPAGAGQSADPGNPVPTGGPGPVPEMSTTSPAPAPGVEVRARGGVIRVSCTDRKAQILSLDVTAGYTVGEYRPGPADEVKAVLVSSANKSEIRVRCDKGAPAPAVKETPSKP